VSQSDELGRIQRTLGSLEAQAEEGRKQSAELFNLIRAVSQSLEEVKIQVAEHRAEYNAHVKGSDTVQKWVDDYRANKNKAIGIFAAVSFLIVFIGTEVAKWAKAVIAHWLS